MIRCVKLSIAASEFVRPVAATLRFGRRGWGAFRVGGLFTLGLLFVAATGRADVSWLQPEAMMVTPGAVASTVALKGDVFGEPSGPIPADEVIAIEGRLANQLLPMPGAVLGASGLRFTTTFPRPGVAALAVQLKPQVRQIPHELVERYLRAVHANDDIRAKWESATSGQAWTELGVTRLKTYLRVGEPAVDDRTWETSVATGLDLIPGRDPTQLRAGELFPIRVVRDGRPVAGCVIDFVSTGEMREHVVITAVDGGAAAPLDIRGVWLVRAIDIQHAGAADHEWETDNVAMTVDVR